ncbi:MAG: DUF5320 domain-containing protein [bacterium]
MPCGDGTGPLGYGPMTGGRIGFCAGYWGPGCFYPGGYRGFGRGFRNRHWAWATGMPRWGRLWGWAAQPVQETEALRAEAKFLEEELAAIKQRLAELEGPSGEKREEK